MTALRTRVAPSWLRLREPADAAARSVELVERLRGWLPSDAVAVVHDLGSGDGSLGRWLAPLLGGRQRWVLHDIDADLLTLAEERPPVADGPVEVSTRVDDVAALDAGALAGADLVATSALLDLLTADELEGLLGAVLAPGCPLLLTLSVTGRVRLTPDDPLDAVLAVAFDDHQRRVSPRGPLLGPDAPTRATALLEAAGREVHVAASPWRLGPDEPGGSALLLAWLEGWVGAAVEHEPGLARQAAAYLTRRRTEAAQGRLRASVGHADLLARPREGR